jgi:hypothetical protein
MWTIRFSCSSGAAHIGYTGAWFSVFVEAAIAARPAMTRDPNLESDGPIDLHQAYLTLGNHKEFPLSLKIGRQELIYGDERLVGAFGWNNIGRVFDAAKLRWQNPWFAADFFTGRVVIPERQQFQRGQRLRLVLRLLRHQQTHPEADD